MNQDHDFTQGSILGKMVKFMLPILAALILQAMYGAVDLLIVGRYGSASGISGVSTGSNITALFTFVVCALATGVTVRLGMYLGMGNRERVGKLIGGAIAFFAVLSLGLSALMIALAKPIAILMQAPDEALDQTVTYIRICGGGFLFVAFYNLISSIFRGLGDSRMPLIFVTIACVVNIVGDLLLVAVFHMDVAGAALATVAAQAVSVILSIIIVRKRNLAGGLSLKNIRFNEEVPAFVKVGIPLAFQEVLTNFSFLALCAFINRLGLDASSGYGVGQKIQSFVMLIPSAIMQSMASMVSQNVGAGKEDRAKQCMLYGMGAGSFIGIFIGLLVFFRGNWLSSFFTTDPQVIARSAEFLRGFAPEAVVTCIAFSFLGYFNGHAWSTFVMAQGLMQSFIVRLPMSYFMSIQENASLAGIGAAAPSATCFGILLCVLYYRHKAGERSGR